MNLVATFTLALAIPFSFASLAAVNAKAKPGKRVNLNSKVVSTLNQNFSTFKVYESENFIAQIQKYTGTQSAKETPMAVEGDFDGDASVDLVLLILGKKKAKGSKTKTFLVFISSIESKPTLSELMEMEKIEPRNIDVSLTLTPKSTVAINGATSAVQSDIFHFGAWGGTTRMYVIRDGQLKAAQYPE